MDGRVRIAALTLTLLIALASVGWARMNPVMLGGGAAAAAPSGILDDFSNSATIEDYTAITTSGMTISGGVANGGADTGTSYTSHIVYHETSTGGNNHYAEAYTSAARAGVVVRCNGATGYIIRITSVGATSYIKLFTFNGETISDPNKFVYSDVELTIATLYKLKVTVSSGTFHIYLDVNDDGDYQDANEDWGTISDSTYSSGQYVGLYFSEIGGNAIADDFAGGGL